MLFKNYKLNIIVNNLKYTLCAELILFENSKIEFSNNISFLQNTLFVYKDNIIFSKDLFSGTGLETEKMNKKFNDAFIFRDKIIYEKIVNNNIGFYEGSDNIGYSSKIGDDYSVLNDKIVDGKMVKDTFVIEDKLFTDPLIETIVVGNKYTLNTIGEKPFNDNIVYSNKLFRYKIILSTTSKFEMEFDNSKIEILMVFKDSHIEVIVVVDGLSFEVPYELMLGKNSKIEGLFNNSKITLISEQV